MKFFSKALTAGALVVAALAAASGAEAIGVTLQLYDYGAATGRKGACCAGDDIIEL